MEENKSCLRIRIKCLKKAPPLTDSSDGCETAHDEGKPSWNGDTDETANVEYPNSRIPTCPECGKTFRSDKSLYGHLRCHPNRGYRGAVPPPMAAKKRRHSEARGSAAMPLPSELKRPTAKRGRTWPGDNEGDVEDAAAIAAHILMLMSRAKLVVIGNGLKTSDGKRIAKKEKMEELELVSAEPGTCSRRYECRVCMKSFASHQALGGHKASHRKNKITNPKEETKVNVDLINEAASKSNSPDACGSEYQKEAATHDPSPSAHSSDQPDHKEASCRLFDFDLNEIPYPEEGEES